MPLTFIEEAEGRRVDPAAIEKYLREHAPEIAELVRKDMTAADVHVATALGNEKPKKERKCEGCGKALSVGYISHCEECAATNAAKRLKEGDWRKPLDIIKTDDEKRVVGGFASVSSIGGKLVIDKQDDVIAASDLEEASWEFVLYSRTQGDMHEKRDVGQLVASYVHTAEKEAQWQAWIEKMGTGGRVDMRAEFWWVEFRVNDDKLWKMIKSGERPEFSIGGQAERVPI